jgi:hypothetical protein
MKDPSPEGGGFWFVFILFSECGISEFILLVRINFNQKNLIKYR